MSLSVPEIAEIMIEAARADAGDRWPQLQALAECELRRLAQALADVEGLLAAGKVTESHATQLVHMHQIAARSVLVTIEGIGLLTAQQAIHAGVRAAETINGPGKRAPL
ncbi:MAG TPA: hypothetical protein VF432_17935 [Thermoanaerobaculia bacterium]